jgi:hypothetical protein
VSVPDSGIPKEWIEAARALVEQNIKPTNKGRRPWELKGHLFCECGVRMTTHTTTRKGRKVVYYFTSATGTSTTARARARMPAITRPRNLSTGWSGSCSISFAAPRSCLST